MGQESCDTTTTTRDEPEAADSEPTKKKPRRKKAGIGDTITLRGTVDPNLKIRATVTELRYVQGGEFDRPTPDYTHIGVFLSLRNVGSVTYNDSPMNGAAMIVAGDMEAEPAMLTEGPCSLEFATGTKIAPGGRRVGCIAFEVPEEREPKLFQFSLDSGFADENAEWRLR